MDLQDFVTQLERILRIGITIIVAYLVALWIASVWWTFRDIRGRTTDIFLQVAATLLVAVFSFPGLLIYVIGPVKRGALVAGVGRDHRKSARQPGVVPGGCAAHRRPDTAVISAAALEQEAVIPVVGQRNGEADTVASPVRASALIDHAVGLAMRRDIT